MGKAVRERHTLAVAGYEPTSEQRQILAHSADRHGRVLAGPGTGKSATVVALITELLAQPSPPRVRLLTFTRSATAELAQKVAEHPEAVVERPSTIHSFAISALLRNPGSADFPTPLRLADDWELKEIVAPELSYMSGVTPSFVKRRLIPEMAANWESLEPEPHPEVDEPTRHRFLAAWDEHRRVYGYTLLSELPDLLRRALEAHADLEGLDYTLLVVDEYQDLNACDLRVLRLLASRGIAILGLGDDEQSIYSFRKAAPEGIRRFLIDYPGSADYTLTVSHRCGSQIVGWARHVIETDPHRDRHRPRLRSASDAPPGETALLAFDSQTAEARGVAQLVAGLVQEDGLDPSDLLVLFRGDHNGVFSRPIKHRLADFGVAVDDPTWVTDVLIDTTNRGVLLLARLLADPADSLAWAGLLKLESGIGPALARSVYARATQAGSTFAKALLATHTEGFPAAPGASRRRAADLVGRVLAWLERQQVPDELDDGRWGGWIIEALHNDPAAPVSHSLGDLLLGVDELVEPQTGLERYLGQLQPLARDRAQAQGGGVRFMSMSMSKGLTVEAAIVVAAEEGVIPRPDADIAEERRLMYVALTRARRFQFVTWARRRTGPTARSGAPRVGGRRTESRLLRNGPVAVVDGERFLSDRFQHSGIAA